MSDIEESLEIGEILQDRYEILEVIGCGAYGVVYRAEDKTLPDVQWAVKEVREGELSLAERGEALEAFKREARLLKSLNHTGIPKIIDSFSTGPHHYMVMEFIAGKTLQELVKEKRPDEETVIKWGLKICDILDYLHNLKPEPLIFRDLKMMF